MLDDGLDQRRHLVRLGEIIDHGQGIDALLRQLRLGLREFRGLARADRNFCAHLSQTPGDLQPQAARTAGDESHTALQLE